MPVLSVPVSEETRATEKRRPIRVFLMDLLCTVPYYTGHLSKALMERDLDMDVELGSITYDLDPGYFASEGLKQGGVLCDVVGQRRLKPALRRSGKLLEYLINLLWVTVRFLGRPPDVVHVQFLPLLRYRIPLERWFLRLMQARGAAVVYTVHNVLPQDTGDAYFDVFRRIYETADLLICHNDAARSLLMEKFGVEASRIRTIAHGPLSLGGAETDPETARRALGIPDGQCMVLWQGFIRPYKGIAFLLDSWRILQQEKINAKLMIVGGGEPGAQEEIVRQIAALGVGESVETLFGFQPLPVLAQYYQAADVVVYPYREITASGALMTGLSYRKPIVATALPAFRELMQSCRRAELVEYGDTGELARVLGRLAADPAERKALAEELALLQPSWRAIAEQTRACYTDAVRQRSR